MEGYLVLNLDKVRQGVAVGEGELLHKTQMDLLLDKVRQIMTSVEDFRQQFDGEQRKSPISHRRHHDAILLSGARGTGKTTFLLSVLHKLQEKKLDDTYAFCVFEPVDPTLFGCNEHILFTLLSLIAREVCRCRDHCDTARYCRDGGSGDWETWDRQLKELAEGLKTVGEQREDIDSDPSPQKDLWDNAEYLLEEGINKARSSYELEYKLHAFIHTSLKLLHKDAFVLGLDDVDTRPGIGWHVLEVLRRYLTTPQLIVIVSGNMELFQKLVERRQLKNFGLDFSSNKKRREEFAPQVMELTNQYLLKVLRTPLRIELLPFYEALERALPIKTTEEGGQQTIDIDNRCVIELYHKKISLAAVLETFYSALSCTGSHVKAAFRKALLTNSARTVLQIAEQLIELHDTLPKKNDKQQQDTPPKESNEKQQAAVSKENDEKQQDTPEKSVALSRGVADILRVAFFDYLAASGITQPQEYFERLRDGTGVEKISRLLLDNTLPGDVSLRPVHGDLQANNSLLALTSGLTAAVAGNAGIFFVYFFKVCLALHVLEGRQKEDINALLGETSLDALGFRCSSLLYGDARRPGWRAPGILALYGASIKKNIPEHVKKIYGEDIVDLLKEQTPKNLFTDQAELLPFIEKVCGNGFLTKKRGRAILRGYVISTYDSLQDDISSWHQAFVPHGFYEIAEQGGNYPFFSIWGLLGLMAEILTCATEEDIFNAFSRNARIMRLAYHSDTHSSSPAKNADADSDDNDDDDTDSPLETESGSAQDSATGGKQSAKTPSSGADNKLNAFIGQLMAWKNQYAAQPLCFLPPLLCQRVFTRFLQGMERLDSLNNGSVFLGSYIHKALVILFNSLLVEEYLACHDNAEGLNLTTPLSSDNIFIQNFRKVADAEALGEDSGPVNLPSARYPLTRLVMACPLWSFYVKPAYTPQNKAEETSEQKPTPEDTPQNKADQAPEQDSKQDATPQNNADQAPEQDSKQENTSQNKEEQSPEQTSTPENIANTTGDQKCKQNTKIVFCMLKSFWPEQDPTEDADDNVNSTHDSKDITTNPKYTTDDIVSYLNGSFNNLYYIYNTLAIRRRLGLTYDLRTERGKAMEMSEHPQKIMTKTLVDAFREVVHSKTLTKDELKAMDDGTNDFAKKAFNKLYIPCPSTERLWANATDATKKAILKGLRDIINEDKAGNTK